MTYYICLVVMLLRVAEATNSSGCNDSSCLSVKAVSLSLEDVIEDSPFYTLQTGATEEFGVTVDQIDSVCFNLYRDNQNSPTYSQGTVTLTNGTVFLAEGIRTDIGCGRFQSSSPTNTYTFLYVKKVCSDIYINYRCPVDTNAPSTQYYPEIQSFGRRTVDEDCLLQAENITLSMFPNTQLTRLPNKVQYPCLCNPGGLRS